MLNTEEVNQMWRKRVSAIQEENGELVQHLRDEIERLQNRCNSLVYETTLMRANCAYDFKTICEGKCNERGMVPMSVVYDIVKEYAPDGLVTVPEKYKGEGALGKASEREARKRSRFQSRKELSAAIKDPNNLGHINLDEETRKEELPGGGVGGAEEDDVPTGYYSAHRKPLMNSRMIMMSGEGEQQQDKQRRLEFRRQEAIQQQQQDQAQKIANSQASFFGQPAGGASSATAGGNVVLADSNGVLPDPQAGSVSSTTAGGSMQQHPQEGGGLPLLDENSRVFFDDCANRKRPRWAGDLKYLNQQQQQEEGNGNQQPQSQQQGGPGFGASCRFDQFNNQQNTLYQDAEQDELPDVEFELHSERPQRQLRFNYEDPYAKA